MDNDSGRAVVAGVDVGAIVGIFAAHLELSLQHSHPEKAARSAYAAVEGYLQSYSFVDTSTKDSSGPSWRQVAKRETKSKL